ncbi:MAG: cytochrome c-type biogenesis protein CcmH [Rhodospirillum sp.]|nr:cytochrome c-type biogenesis protein CcmH [Rhodospirillum sp.]MCF8491462.1 cytochrome c-type biogenesis protein CcmH [Rhodospirillum sp.]MCF8498870.1 cytochrome c-type biogenesis protein CcmH [Rhodospirillum sp.]
MIRRLLVPLALTCTLFWGVLASPAGAVLPDEQLNDPALEARAREISAGLRCVVCQSENIDGSNAELARDMRIRVRELLVEGKTNDEVLQYMVDRYGDYVLMTPPFKASTYLLWFGPVLILILGGIGVRSYYRGRTKSEAASGGGRGLSPEERRRLDALLVDDDTMNSDGNGDSKA